MSRRHIMPQEEATEQNDHSEIIPVKTNLRICIVVWIHVDHEKPGVRENRLNDFIYRNALDIP